MGSGASGPIACVETGINCDGSDRLGLSFERRGQRPLEVLHFMPQFVIAVQVSEEPSYRRVAHIASLSMSYWRKHKSARSINQASRKHLRRKGGPRVREGVQQLEPNPRCALKESYRVAEAIASFCANLGERLRLQSLSLT